MAYQRGDVVLIPFPFTDQAGRTNRPALIVSGKKLNSTSDFALVQITKVPRGDRFSVKIDNMKDVTKPLRFVSEIRCQKILIADSSLIITKICEVKSYILDAVIKKIAEVFEE